LLPTPWARKIVAAMLSHTIAAFCIIDDALQAMGYKDDPQAKTPASAILTHIPHPPHSRR